MILIDTHCHLYAEEFKDDLPEVMQRAGNEGVERFYLPAVDKESTWPIEQMEQQYPGKCFGMAGLHPCSVKDDYEEQLRLVEDALAARSFAAIGEIGLDFYWDRNFEEQQYRVFYKQMKWALQRDLPIVIHSRDSMDQSIESVRQEQNGRLRGIFHCFGGSNEQAKKIIDLGFYLGIGGVLTYKNSGLPAALSDIPMEWMVLETDAPYLAPVPFRGKRNESSYLKLIAEKLALVKGIPVEEVAEKTTANALKIFGD